MTDDATAFARRRIGEVIQAARLRRRMERSQLAVRIGASPEHIARIEAGLDPLELVEFHALAAALDLSSTEFFAKVACNLPEPQLWPLEAGFFARATRMLSASLSGAVPRRRWG